MANIKELIQSIESLDSSFDEKLEALNQMEETLVAMRQQEQEAIDDNVDLIVEAINVMQKKVDAQLVEIQAIIPEKGDKGDKGADGKQGKDGLDGKDGKDGLNGKDGIDGKDGVSVTDAKIDFDGSLIISLSTGQEINVGEVVAPELQEKIKLVTSGGAGTVLPSQTGNANKYLKTDGTALSWAAGDGTGTVTSVGTSGTVNGITLTGGPITSSGTVTLGGTLDLSSPPAIGGTTPSTGTFTTLTAQTETIKGTGQNFLLQSSSLTTSPWALVSATSTGSQSDPFGGTTATLINDGTGASTQHYLAQGFSALAANTYTFSVYAKSGTSNYIGIYSTTPSQGAFFNLTTGAFSANIINAPNSYTITDAGGGWWRIGIRVTITANSSFWLMMSEDGTNYTFTGTSKTVYVAAPQVEVGSTLNTYVSTTTTAVYGTPSLSFSGVAGLGLQSDGSLYVSPAGTGALQAQATTSSATGGNARGANAVDWQTTRYQANQVASGAQSVISGGYSSVNSGTYGFVGGGNQQIVTSAYGVIAGGVLNTVNGQSSCIVGGSTNSSNGWFNFIGGGFTNSGTAQSSVTTQSGTMNATTAVTLSGSNANIKVGQYITGTSIATGTYVAAISGTSLTLSQAASGSSTSTLSFYTPHGVVVGGGNNQATGSYSFIGGGGDAGTATNRNVASGDWSFVGGGLKNSATSNFSFVGGGYGGTASTGYGAVVVGGGFYGNSITQTAPNTASNTGAFVGGGYNNNASGFVSSVLGSDNSATSSYSSVLGGARGTTRGIIGSITLPACSAPFSTTQGSAQSALLILGRETTNATATVLASDNNSASGTNQVILPNNSAYYFRGEVVAGVTGAGDTKGWYVEGVIKRGAGVGTTALVGTPTVSSLYADVGAATWAVTALADTTNGGLKITVTGQASTTIRWVAQIRTTEMTF
jgi:hypothetical protein